MWPLTFSAISEVSWDFPSLPSFPGGNFMNTMWMSAFLISQNCFLFYSISYFTIIFLTVFIFMLLYFKRNSYPSEITIVLTPVVVDYMITFPSVCQNNSRYVWLSIEESLVIISVSLWLIIIFPSLLKGNKEKGKTTLHIVSSRSLMWVMLLGVQLINRVQDIKCQGLVTFTSYKYKRN